MHTVSYIKSVLYLLAGVLLWLIVIVPVHADEQARFSSQTNLLTIPYVIINNKQIFYDIEMPLQPSGQFSLTTVNQQPSLQAYLGQEYDLSMDQSIWYKANTEYRIKLIAVTEDLRCPIGMACDCEKGGMFVVCEEPVRLVFALYQGVIHKKDFILTLGGDSGNDSIIIDDRVAIQLLRVQPYPNYNTELTSADYIATIRGDVMFD